MDYTTNNSRPDVSVIIVSWNTKDLLRKCLQSVFNETRKATLEVWVVDNDSPDLSADMVREEFPQVKLIANSDNKGFALANNQAMNLSSGRFILLLNPDTEVLSSNGIGAIDAMVGYAEKHQTEKVGILTCKLLNGDGTLQKSVNRFYNFWRSFLDNRFMYEMIAKLKGSEKLLTSHWEHDSIKEIDWAYGAVMFFSKESMDRVGVLDPQFYIYAEEMDYFMRYRKAGYTSWFLSDIEIIHYGKSSSRQRRAAMFIQNYKSFYLFLKKHYSGLDFVAYRIRAQIYLTAWYLKYSLSTGEEAKQQKQVYAETLKWHFTKESLFIS